MPTTHGPDEVVATLAPPFAVAAIALARSGELPSFHIAAPGRAVTARTFWRAASLSKMVTARTLEAVGGSEIWAADASEALGFRLRHPGFPQVGVTLGMLAAHASGLTDAAGYAVPGDATLGDWLAEAGNGAWLPHPPGGFLHYCNLGFVLLAAAAERIGGDRFDRLARRHVLGPLGIEGGFAWSGVPPARRADRLPAFRRSPPGFVAQIDAAVAPDGLSGPDGTALTLRAPGENPAPLSPQGGLRLSLEGALKLAQALGGQPLRRLWTPAQGPGDYGDGFLESTGPGLLVYDDPTFYLRPLVGHFAEAYGILAGAWHDRIAGASFAYVLNGLPDGDEDAGWRLEELAIFAAVARAV